MAQTYAVRAVYGPARSKSRPYVPVNSNAMPRKRHWYQGWFKSAWLYLRYDHDALAFRAFGALLYYLFDIDIRAMLIQGIISLIPGGQVVDVAYVPETPIGLGLGAIALLFLNMGKRVNFYRRYWHY